MEWIGAHFLGVSVSVLSRFESMLLAAPVVASLLCRCDFARACFAAVLPGVGRNHINPLPSAASALGVSSRLWCAAEAGC